MRIIDLSHDIYSGMPVLLGDPETDVREGSSIASTGYNITRLIFSSHVGTHLDAPSHFFDRGCTVDKLDLMTCVGPARVIKIPDKGPRSEIHLSDIEQHREAFAPGARVILNFGWYKVFPEERFYAAMPGIRPECTRWIADSGIALLGLDLPGLHAEYWKETHQILLRKGIVIVEALTNLDAITADEIYFVALPLKIQDGDGSPVRAIAIENSGGRTVG